MKINCVIVDDEPENLKYLQQIVEDINDVVIVKSFTDANSFVNSYKDLAFDMCILDNHLPDGKGLELAKRLMHKKVIFVSAHDISAHEAYDVNAIDVLKKPVSKERLQAAIKKCRDKIINEKGFAFFKTSEGNMKFKWQDIIYIKTGGESQAKLFITTEGEVRALKLDFEYILSKLPDDLFCQVSKSHIINTQYFKTLKDAETIVLNFKERSIVKKKKNKEFIKEVEMVKLKEEKTYTEIKCNPKNLERLKILVGLNTAD